ncbi:MAG: hypothetical protein QF662_08420, partial [Phycisphaerae bacterium]|nr:hypothetical protein [Phycisphaerae bacterium]
MSKYVKRLAVAGLLVATFLSFQAAPAVGTSSDPQPKVPKKKRKVLLVQSHDLYVGQWKAGYRFSSLVRIEEGGSHSWQIETSTFLAS